eukprot:TRINITY_DN8769_c2_g1_i1.p1 TRINITY_DN8769_c2_g1~~TRINITY_DN8769_c2_g1_i1.p1  ORF type:complete len:124 (+),score=17.48 TRINITY_DN8769_c2_g1_i1:328-699(+)
MKEVRGGVDLPGNLIDGVKYIIRQLRKTHGEIPNSKLYQARKMLESARDMAETSTPEQSDKLLLNGLKYAVEHLCEARNYSKSSALAEIHEYALQLYIHFYRIHRQQQNYMKGKYYAGFYKND